MLALEVEGTALLLISAKDDISGNREFDYRKLRVIKTRVDLFVNTVFVLYFEQVTPGNSFKSLVVSQSALFSFNKLLTVDITRQVTLSYWRG